jgi:uncharacterized membrane protein YhaH (DUF805 family)
VVVLIPWSIWGFVIHIERLHDRDKSAWWLLVFYGLPALLGPVSAMVSFPGGLGAMLYYILALAGFALSIRDLLKSAVCRGLVDRTATAPTRFCGPNKPAG